MNEMKLSETREEKISIKTPEFVSLQFQSAGLGSRSVAFMIDQLLLMIISIMILVILYLFTRGQHSFVMIFDTISVPVAIAIILIFVINASYHFLLEYFTGGRTVGKKLLGIRVIQENGHSITLLSSFIRNLLRIIDSLPASYLVGILMIFFHDKHKRLGDMVAGTLVVHEREQKKGKKKSHDLDMVIRTRNITKNHLEIEDWVLKSVGTKEWNLLKAYTERFVQLPSEERYELSRSIGDVLLLKIGVEMDGKSTYDIENLLLALYLHLKEEWEYEL